MLGLIKYALSVRLLFHLTKSRGINCLIGTDTATECKVNVV